MVKDHSDSERGNPLPPHGLLFPISSKGSFICTIPQTGQHIPQPLLHQSWSTGWNEIFRTKFSHIYNWIFTKWLTVSKPSEGVSLPCWRWSFNLTRGVSLSQYTFFHDTSLAPWSSWTWVIPFFSSRAFILFMNSSMLGWVLQENVTAWNASRQGGHWF